MPEMTDERWVRISREQRDAIQECALPNPLSIADLADAVVAAYDQAAPACETLGEQIITDLAEGYRRQRDAAIDAYRRQRDAADIEARIIARDRLGAQP